MARLTRLSIVLATWCPHCVPLSLENTKRMAEDLGVPFRVLDIEGEDTGKLADEMVREHGDSVEDYLVPQVFAEFEDESVKHFFTGFSESTEVTKRNWENLFKTRFYSELKNGRAS